MSISRSFLSICGLCALAVVVAGCEQDEKERVAFDGVTFKAKAKKIDKDNLAEFTSTVFKVSNSFEGARAAAEYEGTRYCILNFGTSLIDWTVGPDTSVENLRIADDTLTYQGRCDP